MDAPIYPPHSIRTFSGKIFDLDDFKDFDFCIGDIAHGLSNNCRFAGQYPEFYSVAQHSIYVSRQLPPALQLQGLMHDASEAYILDIPRPFKSLFPKYRSMEARIMKAIAKQHFFDWPLDADVKECDMYVFEFEMSAFEKGKAYFETWSPAEAKRRFLEAYHQLQQVD